MPSITPDIHARNAVALAESSASFMATTQERINRVVPSIAEAFRDRGLSPYQPRAARKRRGR